MKYQIGAGLLIATIVLTGWSPVQAAYMQGNQAAVVTNPVNDDAFLSGNSITVSAPIHGELFAAGNTVTVSDAVDRSILAAGNTVTVNNGSGYNAFAAGNSVMLHGTYQHDVYAAGNEVTLASDVVIHGSLYVAGNLIAVHGRIDKDLFVGGSTVTSDATIGGGIQGRIDDLTFTGGSVGQNVAYTSPNTASGLQAVTIHGSVDHKTPTVETFAQATSSVATDILMALLTMLAVGALLILLLPKAVVSVTDGVRTTWGANMILGLAVVFGAPFLALLAFITVVGWPIGFIVLALWGIGLYVATILGIITAGRLLTGVKNTSLWLVLAVGSLVILLLTRLPLVGPLVHVLTFVGLTVPAFGSMLRWLQTKLA